jgi:hypothetical protein
MGGCQEAGSGPTGLGVQSGALYSWLKQYLSPDYFDRFGAVDDSGLSEEEDGFGDIAAGGSGNSLKRPPILLPPTSELSGMLNRGLFPISSFKSRKTFSNRWSSCQRAFALFIISCYSFSFPWLFTKISLMSLENLIRE